MAAVAPVLVRDVAQEADEVEVLTGADEILRFASSGEAILLDGGVTSSAEFFLSSLTKQWGPTVLAVRGGGRLIGIVYAKERLVTGLGTGLAYLDATLPLTVLCGNGIDRCRLIAAASRALLDDPDMIALRAVVPDGCPGIESVAKHSRTAGVEVTSSPLELHSVLHLPATYEDLISRLGYKGRRNFRYYRRKFEDAGGEFVPNMSWTEFEQAVFRSPGKQEFPAD